MMIAALLLLPAAAAPSPEAAALALRLARTGTLSALLPTIAAKETEEMVAAHPELTPDEHARLRATAKSRFDAEVARIDAAFANAYASRLSIDELRALVAQAESAPAKRLRAVQPSVMAEAVRAMGQMDFKGETLAAFCRDTGKACAK